MTQGNKIYCYLINILCTVQDKNQSFGSRKLFAKIRNNPVNDDEQQDHDKLY